MQNMKKDVVLDEGTEANNYTRPAAEYNSLPMWLGEH